MTAEIYKIEIPKRTFVFLSAQRPERFAQLCTALGDLGAIPIGPQAFALSSELTPEAIREVLGDLKAGECVYFIGSPGVMLETRVLVSPREGC